MYRITTPEFNKLPDLLTDEHSDKEQHDHKELNDVDNDDEDFACSSMPVLSDQQNLSDLIRDVGLSKESSEVLASRLKDRIFCSMELKSLFIEHVIKSLCRFLMINLTLFSVKIFLVY